MQIWWQNPYKMWLFERSIIPILFLNVSQVAYGKGPDTRLDDILQKFIKN